MNEFQLVNLAFIVLSLLMFGLLTYLGFSRYLSYKEALLSQKVGMDDYRSHLEKKLIEMNLQFSNSENRWKELNHLVVSGQNQTDNSYQNKNSNFAKSDFLLSHGIDPDDLNSRQDLIFVLTPFHEDFYVEFETIAKVGRSIGFTVNRGDEYAVQGEIFPQLLKLIVESRLLIVNISGRNPNVFYELGIAHALNKQVILVAHLDSEIPFDLKSKQIVFYTNKIDLESSLQIMLSRVLANNPGIIPRG